MLSFTVRLGEGDWDAQRAAWRCPPLRIPGAAVTGVFADGTRIDPRAYSIPEASDFIEWGGSNPVPSAVLIEIRLGKKLVSTERSVWITALTSIATALIAATATVLSSDRPSRSDLALPRSGAVASEGQHQQPSDSRGASTRGEASNSNHGPAVKVALVPGSWVSLSALGLRVKLDSAIPIANNTARVWFAAGPEMMQQDSVAIGLSEQNIRIGVDEMLTIGTGTYFAKAEQPLMDGYRIIRLNVAIAKQKPN